MTLSMNSFFHKIAITSGVFSILFSTAFAQIDRTKAPAPGPAPRINVGKYESFKLKNGMQVFVVTNHKLPMFSASLIFDNDPTVLGNKAGLNELFGDMLQSGTTKRNKEKFDDESDFLGANINASKQGVYVSGLVKHAEKIWELFADMVRNPAFPESELERLRNQAISGLVANQTDPNAISSNLIGVANFGTNHPYGEVTTEETLNNLNINDFKNFHNTNYTPSVAYLAIVGAVSTERARKLAETYFGDWQGGKPIKAKFPSPNPPPSSRVFLHDLETAVQSTIRLTYPIAFTPGSPDRIAVSVLANILGGGSTGRLYKNLRETKAYTYGAYCRFNPDPIAGSFVVSADVKTSVTDSAVYEMVYELNRLLSSGVTQDELQAVKKEMTGSFARSLENAQTIANFAINIARYKLPVDYYETYLQKLNALTTDDIQNVIKKYIKPFNFNLVVVGRRDSIEQGLVQYHREGKIVTLDPYGKPAKALMEVPEGVTLQTVINGYLESIGGIDAIEKINDLKSKLSISIDGQNITQEIFFKKPNMSLQVTKLGSMELQREVFDGTQGKSEGQTLVGNKLADAKATAHPITEYNLVINSGLRAELEGIAVIKGIKAYQVKFISPSGDISRSWYAIAKFTKIRTQSTEKVNDTNINIITEYRGQTEAANVLFPTQIIQTMGNREFKAITESIDINTGISNDIFK
jgi:zinc protease